MSVKANRTVRIPLSVPDQRVDDLHATHNLYQYCQNRTVDWCWPDTPTHPDDLKTSKGDAEDALTITSVTKQTTNSTRTSSKRPSKTQ